MDKEFGIVNVSVASMHRKPNFRSELVNQTLLGTIVRIYDEARGFLLIKNRDEYLGWVAKISLVVGDSQAMDKWHVASHIMCVANYGVVSEQIDGNGRPVVDLVPGALLKKLEERDAAYGVELPDGRSGFVKKEWVVEEEARHKISATQDNLVSTAKTFLGIPYLWGGTSAKAFDCSGFVQTVFRLNNINLPRDAKQMAKIGKAVQPGNTFGNLQPADLLFFAEKNKRISHVAMYVGDGLYIHSDGYIHFNSFDPTHPLYNDFRRQTFRKAKRIL